MPSLDDVFQVSRDVIDNAISKLKNDKSDGDKGLWFNLVINTPSSWRDILGCLISSMITHGHHAEELLLSTLTSLPKNNLGDVCDSNNYRGISLASCVNKVIDWVILLQYRDILCTSDLQFAYKQHHSTAMCTLALKEVSKYYIARRGQVFCCLLDASKAFDRVRYDKLFNVLLERKLPAAIVRFLIDQYSRQKVRTVWEGFHSDTFETSNGVRQGGVLSPILFTVYIDVLLQRLENSGLGCYVGHEYFGGLCSADDLSLLAPNLWCLKRMLEICEKFGHEYGIIFNALKTVCILINGRRQPGRDLPVLTLNGINIKWETSVKHLGNIVSHDLSEEVEIQRKRCDFIGRTNSLIANFKSVQKPVLSKVFMAKCCHFYGSQTWDLDSRYINTFSTTWRKAVRKIWCLPYRTRSSIVPHLLGVQPFEEQLHQRVAKMYNNVRKGHNAKMLLLLRTSMDTQKMGIMGINSQVISRKWLCGWDHLQNNNDVRGDADIIPRVDAIKELVACRDGDGDIPGFTRNDAATLANHIACY